MFYCLDPLNSCTVLFACLALGATGRAEDAYEAAPIHYSASVAQDATRELQKALDAGTLTLDRTDPQATLRGLLKALHIPEASLVLVFSKTSKQNDRISPATPRRIYFSDNAYVGYALGGTIEVATIDPRLGPVFYLLDPYEELHKPLQFVRELSCLSCHGGPFSPDVPGVLVRSVLPSADGHPITSQGTRVVDTTTPFELRWGGWYVTGKHGAMRHMGNVTAQEQGEVVKLDLQRGQNVTDLSKFFDHGPYGRTSSDIVALMVLEHQTSTQNVLTKANQAALRAMYMQQSLQRELHETVEAQPVGSARRIIDHVAEDVLDALLFKDEAVLPDGGIEGGAEFPEAFCASAPHTAEGRSLKDLQLLTRLFKYRCSYMVYSLTFKSLSPPLKETVLARLAAVLRGHDPQQARYEYLGKSEREHIATILSETGVLRAR